MKHMSVKQFRDEGYLQEVNRRMLHPLGLAISAQVDEETGEASFGPILDMRDDPEGIVFDEVDGAKVDHIANEQARRAKARCARLDFWIQPVGARA